MARERRLAFGEVAELYDRARPSYPEALVDDVLEFASASRGDRAVEVGAGTGKATALFAARGLAIVALEPDAEMAEIARRNLARSQNVTIEQTDFEHWAPERGAFKLLFSGQAWHWVTPETRYTRAREALADTGALAVFWNRPRWESCEVRGELADVYRRTVPDLGAEVGPGPMDPAVPTPPEWWGDWAGEVRAAIGFEQPEGRTYSWYQRYATDEYLKLLATHSDHILLEPERREALFAGIARILDDHGGALELEYVTALWMARVSGGVKPAPG